MTQTMPSLFISHGSPMNLVLDNRFTQALETLSTRLVLPKAILVVSAHWYADQTAVSIASGITYETLYDFYGFPPSLYELSYESPSNNSLSKHVSDLLGGIPMIERGLDHGAWMPLYYLFPKASIPVIELSINKHLRFDEHVALGKKLASLRDEGVMLIASGNVTHNLGTVDFYTIDATPPIWAQNVDAYIDHAFAQNDIQSLIDIERRCETFKTAHPSVDHYVPLLYTAGSRRADDTLSVLTPFFQNASLSMRGFMLH